VYVDQRWTLKCIRRLSHQTLYKYYFGPIIPGVALYFIDYAARTVTTNDVIVTSSLNSLVRSPPTHLELTEIYQKWNCPAQSCCPQRIQNSCASFPQEDCRQIHLCYTYRAETFFRSSSHPYRTIASAEHLKNLDSKFKNVSRPFHRPSSHQRPTHRCLPQSQLKDATKP